MVLPNLGRLAKLPLSLKRLTEGLKDTKKPEDTKISALFSNVISIHPPKEDDLLRTFSKQVEDDRIIVISRSNLNVLHKVLEENALMCTDLLLVDTDGVILTKQKAKKVVGWAKNHYLATSLLPNIKGDRLYIPRERQLALGRSHTVVQSRPHFTVLAAAFNRYAGVSTSASDGDQSGRGEGDCKIVKALSWIDLYLPQKVRPYAHLARLDKPIGTWLLAWPCMWSITMAAPPGSLPDFKMMTLFGCGALLLRGAGCTINDLLDRDIDTKVERTKLRPVASGLLSPFEGVSFLGLQLLLGLGILLQLNNYSRVLGASSLLLVFSYPLMKRFTFWPQAFLGLTFNWGALLGWSAIRGDLDPTVVLPLYLSGVCWTLVYDTIYAHQDKDDDRKVGIKSTALRFGDSTKQWISGFGVLCIGNLALSGYNADIGWAYYTFLTAGSGHLAWQIWAVDLSSRADCNKKFVSNKWFGALIYAGILCGRVMS